MSLNKESIVLLGAGKSSAFAIKYLSAWCFKMGVEFVVADVSISALDKISEMTSTPFRTVLLKEDQPEILEGIIQHATVVISMLPVTLHYTVALACIKYAKHLLTASYISPEIKVLEEEVKSKSLAFLFECGLDPGIDHMSAFALLDRIREKGEQVYSFISSTGGLVDPAYEGNNPWQYKFTWNPRNVILAGKGTAMFKEDGAMNKIPYATLFSSARPLLWSGKEALEFYPNRDSLKYQTLYALEGADTFIRGTIRRSGYSEAWHVLVCLGMTDDEQSLPSSIQTHRDFLTHFMGNQLFSKKSLEEKIGFKVSSAVWSKITYLDLATEDLFPMKFHTAAQYLQSILESKWVLEKEDKDWVLMQHRIKTVKGNKHKEYISTLSVKGENQLFTAMSKTVGLPLAMAAVLVFTGQWRKSGIHIPSDPLLYTLLLPQLEKEGITFDEKELEV